VVADRAHHTATDATLESTLLTKPNFKPMVLLNAPMIRYTAVIMLCWQWRPGMALHLSRLLVCHARTIPSLMASHGLQQAAIIVHSGLLLSRSHCLLLRAAHCCIAAPA
jgi:hypothetical protein